MYLFGNYIGSKSSLIIDAKTNKKDVESFLVKNPELKHRITDLDRVKAQYKSMGLEMPKLEVPAAVKTKSKKNGAKKK